MTIIYLNVSLSQYYQPGAASTQGDESFRYLFGFVWFAQCVSYDFSRQQKDIRITAGTSHDVPTDGR